ncbi:UPF0047 protein C4A8.02c [Echinococcus granulosus]|nr:UPF0047 protein C4A8.02c [Echinococcus granulosus]
MPEITQIKIGTLNLFMQHTSCSITLNESWDGDVKDDIEMLLNRLIPEKLNYKHSCEGPDDMPAHAKHAILSGSNVTIPITDGKMNLGTWQGVWFIEHRNQKSSRKVIATLNGCKMPTFPPSPPVLFSTRRYIAYLCNTTPFSISVVSNT